MDTRVCVLLAGVLLLFMGGFGVGVGTSGQILPPEDSGPVEGGLGCVIRMTVGWELSAAIAVIGLLQVGSSVAILRRLNAIEARPRDT